LAKAVEQLRKRSDLVMNRNDYVETQTYPPD
jgi:hypothetical protein